MDTAGPGSDVELALSITGQDRRSHQEINPELVALAKRLRRRIPKTGEQKSLRSIAAELARLGHVNVNGRPFAAHSIRATVRKG
jgi:hypothetical protein